MTRFKKVASTIKEFGKIAKTVGVDFPIEVAKRAVVPGYVERKYFGQNFGKKK